MRASPTAAQPWGKGTPVHGAQHKQEPTPLVSSVCGLAPPTQPPWGPALTCVTLVCRTKIRWHPYPQDLRCDPTWKCLVSTAEGVWIQRQTRKEDDVCACQAESLDRYSLRASDIPPPGPRINSCCFCCGLWSRSAPAPTPGVGSPSCSIFLMTGWPSPCQARPASSDPISPSLQPRD